ncbi:2-keto-4-pentenoate hydratase [Fundicoccus ignavus]|uniref:2-keto-4-pentenoate hydratase n=1 Tax=Fundicoccus ignavus TaxID=2664442 RepID=A0A6I2GGC9_9LACT|nr:fumarylacetoacetate hydrolase family protein [Fundicoccus ignavus]MRI82296.1 2-keto-4-pentenoate hydratase [Fundicoccus ignavus]MRI84551.1 2-keto-4-pentenoate hydratase [Fundicoccus ignavus]MRJ46842.1 2-keto-4-pentenoate hydratase [Fundicoccus ignavus]
MSKVYEPYVVKLAHHLCEAVNQGEGVSPVISEYPALTVKEAYDIQLYNVNAQLAEGKSIVGKKIGLTSKAMQESLGVDEPDYGHLLEDMVITKDQPVIYSDQVLQPRVEGELAFILKEDLVGPNVTVEDVLAATESIVAAIEIVDSRVKDWQITLRDTVADNGSSAFYILGDNHFAPADLDRIGVKMQLWKNGELINEGDGSAVLGDPAYCVAWLANKLYEFDITLKKGEVILAGALSAAIPAVIGDEFEVKFTEGLGDVKIKFEER